MKKRMVFLTGALTIPAFLLSGCVLSTRTYVLKKDRIDQNLSSGNRGYLTGRPPADAENTQRKSTRETRVIEMELGSPTQKKKTAAPPVVTGQEPAYAPEAPEDKADYLDESETYESPAEEQTAEYREYTVQKNDTLQKISMKFFGTTKKWHKIFKANSDKLKGADKIYPGQVIRIPVEEGMGNDPSLK